MNSIVASACRASVGPIPGATPIYYARKKAARCLASGWTMEQATGRYSEYGWLRSFDKSPRRPLATLVLREIEVDVDREYGPMVARINELTRGLA